MGTYRQPASLVDIQSGKMARQAIERGFKGLEKIAAASIKQAEKRAKQEEEYKKAEKGIWEKSAIMLAKGNSLVEKNRIDGASLGTGVKMVTDDIAKARIENLRLSTNDPRYQENLAVIGNGMQFLDGLNSTLEGGVYYEQTVQDAIQNGVGYAPGQIAPGSATAEWLEANSQTDKIDMGWNFSFEVRKEDDGIYKLYNIGKKGESVIVNPIQAMSKDDEDISTMNYGAFRVNPDPSKDTKEILVDQGVLGKDGAISDRYTTTEQKVIGGKVYNVTTNNLEELTDVSNSAADVAAEEIISNGGESMVDTVRMVGKRNPDNPDSKAWGYEFPEVDENNNYVRNSDGTIKIGKWRQITDDNGEIVQDASFPSETGRVDPEQYDLFMQMIRARTAADNGLFAPQRRELDGVATRAYQKSTEGEKPGKLTITERKALNTDNVITQAIDEMPTKFPIKDLTSSSKEDVIAKLEQSPKKVIESLSGMYPDFIFSNPEDGPIEDLITVESKYNGRKTKIEVNDREADNTLHYEDMVKWMKENAEPSGELRLKQQLESVLPNKSIVSIEEGLFKIQTPEIKAITTTEDGEKVIEYNFEKIDKQKFDLTDKEAMKAYLRNKLIGFDIDYLQGAGSKVTTINESGGNPR